MVFDVPAPSNIGVACPQCDEGQLVERRSKQGVRFYGCDRYPRCRFTVGGRPVAEHCPECGSSYLLLRNHRLRCPNQGCGFVKKAEPSHLE